MSFVCPLTWKTCLPTDVENTPAPHFLFAHQQKQFYQSAATVVLNSFLGARSERRVSTEDQCCHLPCKTLLLSLPVIMLDIFSNCCDSYKVTTVVHENRSDNHCNWSDTELLHSTTRAIQANTQLPSHTHTHTHTHTHILSLSLCYNLCSFGVSFFLFFLRTISSMIKQNNSQYV